MKAILINPITQTVVNYDFEGDFRDIQEILGVDLFTCIGLENGDTLYVDDEGLINGTNEFFFAPSLYPTPLAGKGLILGTDEMGDSCDCETELPLACTFMDRMRVAVLSRLEAFDF